MKKTEYNKKEFIYQYSLKVKKEKLIKEIIITAWTREEADKRLEALSGTWYAGILIKHEFVREQKKVFRGDNLCKSDFRPQKFTTKNELRYNYTIHNKKGRLNK